MPYSDPLLAAWQLSLVYILAAACVGYEAALHSASTKNHEVPAVEMLMHACSTYASLYVSQNLAQIRFFDFDGRFADPSAANVGHAMCSGRKM